MLERVDTVTKRLFAPRRPQRRGAPADIVLETCVLDPAHVAARLCIDERARRAAIQWQATDSSRGPDANEQLFRSHHEEILRAILASARGRVHEVQARWRSACQKSDPGRFEELLDRAQQSLMQKKVMLRDKLIEARRAMVDARRRQRALLDRHQVDPPAEPEHRGVILGGLFLGLALEAVFNAHFFALAEQDGWLGGFTIAFLAALVNVAVSFFAGWVMRGIAIPGARRIVGAACAAGWLSGLIIYQLSIGHYRAALVRVPAEQAMAAAIDTLTTNPLGIADLQAWLLVLIGLIFAGVSAAAGVALADPVPGWRTAVKRLKAAEETYATLQDQLLTGVQQAYDEQISKVDARLAEARVAVTDAIESVAEMRGCREAHEAIAASTAASYATIIGRYRQVFERVIGQAGPPHFRVEPRLPVPVLLDDFGLPADKDVSAERDRLLKQAAEDVKRKLLDSRKRDLAAVPTFIGEIERVADGFPAAEAEPGTSQLTLWPMAKNGGAHVTAN